MLTNWKSSFYLGQLSSEMGNIKVKNWCRYSVLHALMPVKLNWLFMTNCAVVIRALVEKLETRVKIMVLNFAANRGIAAEPNQTNRGL